jgi:hypothetical protein
MSVLVVMDSTTMFEGFHFNYKLSDNVSKTMVIAEVYRRLETILQQLNFAKLLSSLRNESFHIQNNILDLKDDSKIFISSL